MADRFESGDWQYQYVSHFGKKKICQAEKEGPVERAPTCRGEKFLHVPINIISIETEGNDIVDVHIIYLPLLMHLAVSPVWLFAK